MSCQGGNLVKLNFSITELSSLTKKSRPTLYKYIDAYDYGVYDDIPYSFITLFELMNREGVSRKEIIAYCEANFQKVEEDPQINEIVSLLKQNKDRINFSNLKDYLNKELAK